MSLNNSCQHTPSDRVCFFFSFPEKNSPPPPPNAWAAFSSRSRSPCSSFSFRSLVPSIGLPFFYFPHTRRALCFSGPNVDLPNHSAFSQFLDFFQVPERRFCAPSDLEAEGIRTPSFFEGLTIRNPSSLQPPPPPTVGACPVRVFSIAA